MLHKACGSGGKEDAGIDPDKRHYQERKVKQLEAGSHAHIAHPGEVQPDGRHNDHEDDENHGDDSTLGGLCRMTGQSYREGETGHRSDQEHDSPAEISQSGESGVVGGRAAFGDDLGDEFVVVHERA